MTVRTDLKAGDTVSWEGRQGVIREVENNGIRTIVWWYGHADNTSAVDARVLTKTFELPNLWWLHVAEDHTNGAIWTRQPNEDDIAFVEQETGKKHIARRLVLAPTVM